MRAGYQPDSAKNSLVQDYDKGSDVPAMQWSTRVSVCLSAHHGTLASSGYASAVLLSEQRASWKGLHFIHVCSQAQCRWHMQVFKEYSVDKWMDGWINGWMDITNTGYCFLFGFLKTQDGLPHGHWDFRERLKRPPLYRVLVGTWAKWDLHSPVGTQDGDWPLRP